MKIITLHSAFKSAGKSGEKSISKLFKTYATEGGSKIPFYYLLFIICSKNFENKLSKFGERNTMSL